MSVAGAVFAALVLATVVGGVWAEVSWRGRHSAPAHGQVPELSRAADAGSGHAVLTVARAVAAAVVAAGISVASSIVSVRGAFDGSLPPTTWSTVVSLALVALATVVGTLGSSRNLALGSVVGLLLGAPPSWFVIWVALLREGDPLGGVAGLFYMVLTGGVSAAAWALAIAARRGSRQLVRSLGPFRDRQRSGR